MAKEDDEVVADAEDDVEGKPSDPLEDNETRASAKLSRNLSRQGIIVSYQMPMVDEVCSCYVVTCYVLWASSLRRGGDDSL